MVMATFALASAGATPNDPDGHQRGDEHGHESAEATVRIDESLRKPGGPIETPPGVKAPSLRTMSAGE